MITSTTNSTIKWLRSLKDKKNRAESAVFFVEGANSVRDIPIDARLRDIFVRESDINKYSDIIKAHNVNPILVADNIFDTISDTISASGILAVLDFKEHKELSSDTVIVLDRIMDAGNMGTIIRTAAAFGIKDIITLNCVDVYNPKVVRASMTGIHFVNVLDTKFDDLVSTLQGYDILCMDARGTSIKDFVRPQKIAIVIGNEAQGVNPEILKLATETISIPMVQNSVESLNASIALAIACYELKK